MRMIFHPGAPKCATTYLQEKVFSNLPNVSCLGRPNHASKQYQEFRTALVHAENIGDIKSSYAALVDSGARSADINPTVIISDETLFTTPSHMAVAERLRLCNDKSEIILTVRDQRTALLSLYQAYGRKLRGAPEPYTGRHVTFESWMELVMRKGEPRFDFWKAYRGYSGVFGRDRVHIIPFELIRDDREKMKTIISSILGVERSDIRPEKNGKKINSAPSARLIRYHKIRSHLFYGSNMTKYVPGGTLIRRMLNVYLERGKAIPPEFGNDHLAWIRLTFGQGNKSLAEATDNEYIRNYLIN